MKQPDKFARAMQQATQASLGPSFAAPPAVAKPAVALAARITVSLPAAELETIEGFRRDARTRRIPNQSEVVRAGLVALARLDAEARSRLLDEIIAK